MGLGDKKLTFLTGSSVRPVIIARCSLCGMCGMCGVCVCVWGVSVVCECGVCVCGVCVRVEGDGGMV